MKKHKDLLLFFVLPLLISEAIAQRTSVDLRDDQKWSGKVSWTKTSGTKGRTTWLTNGLEEAYRWDKFFEYKIEVVFVKGKGTVVRADFTKNFEKDSVVFVFKDKQYLIEEKRTKITCNGNDTSLLEVLFDDAKKNYWISFYTPTCPESLQYEKISNIYPAITNSSTNDHPGIQINLPASFTGHPVGKNPNILSGTWEEIIPAPNDPGSSGITTRGTWSLRRQCPPWTNALTTKNIATLKSSVKAAATRFVQRVNDELCIKLKVASATRTIAEQNELYAQGRTKPGLIVTWAKGGESRHNSASAIDVYVVLEDGSLDIGGEVPPEVVDIGKQEGFSWGGDWIGRKRDPPHFEMRP